MSSNTVTSLNTYTNIHDDVPNRLHNITVLEYTHDVHEITVSLRKIKIQLNDNLAINILCNNIHSYQPRTTEWLESTLSPMSLSPPKPAK